jgi:hypothetical protein
MILDFIKSINFLITKTKTFFISLIVSILFCVIASQGTYAIPSEYLTNGSFETSTFSGSPMTNLGFDNKIINDGGFGHPGSSNQQISLASLDGMNTTEAVVDNNIYNVWSENLSGNNEIFIAVSTNGGKSFTDPKNISNNPGSSENPVIAVSGNNVYVAWSDNTSDNYEILFVKSTNAGDNFTHPKNISNNPGSSENPAIAVSGNAIYLAWSDNTSGNPPVCSSAKADPNKLWPPNSHMIPIDIDGVTDAISIKVDTITQDEPTGNSADGEIKISPEENGNSTQNVRAEKKVGGNSDGRVYRINFTASDSRGATCSGSVTVEVPPNQNREAKDSGQKYDSTKPNQFIDNNIQNLRSDSTPETNEIFFIKSTNAGDNFTDPENISNNPGSSENPAIAVSGNAVYVVWSNNTSNNNEILFVKSTNAGDNFTDPENISNNPGSSDNPSIAVSGNAVYVVWSNSASNSEILFIKSTNAGDNFTDPENISNNAGTSENPIIAVSGNTVYVVWIDTTSGNNQVPVSVSENGGKNFSTPIIISNNADDISNPQITISGDNVSITWIDNSSGNNKIVIAESTDGGNSFNAPRTISNNPYVYVTWTEDSGNTGLVNAFIAVSNDNGTLFNRQNLSNIDQKNTFAGEISDPVVFGSNVYATFIEGNNATNESDAFIAVSNDSGKSYNRQNLSNIDPNGLTQVFPLSKPVVSKGNVYVTWTESDIYTGDSDAFIAVSNDNGASFNTIKKLSIPDPNGTTVASSLSEPIVSAANVYVTWTEYEHAGTDKNDIFIAVSHDNGVSFEKTQRLSLTDPSGPTAVSDIGVSKLPVVSGDNVYVTWIEDEYAGTNKKDAFIAVSHDNGTSFNPAKRLSIPDENGPTDADRVNNPVVSGDNVYVTWIEDENSFTNKNDIFIAVSNDNGATFRNTTSLSIPDPNGPTDDENHNNLDVLPVASGNSVFVTWLEEEKAGSSEKYDAFIAVSNDTGHIFNTTRLSVADPNGPTSADHITNPVVSGDNVYTTWIERTNASNSNEDAFIAVSNDTGKKFNTMNLSIPDPNGSTNIDDGVEISAPIISGSNVYVTWNEEPDTQTEQAPFIAVSNNTGQTFNTTNLSILDRGEGSSIDFNIKTPVVSGSGVYVTWIERDLNIERERDAFIGVSNDKGVTFHTTNLSKINPDGGTRANNIINDPVVSGDNIYVTWREVWRADKHGNIDLAIPFISVSNNTGITFNTEGLSIFDPENTKANARSIGNPVVP